MKIGEDAVDVQGWPSEVMYFTVVTDLGELSKLPANQHDVMLCIQSVLPQSKFQGLRNFNIKGIMKRLGTVLGVLL